MAIDTPQSALAGALFWGVIIYWFYRRRAKKKQVLAAAQRREEDRLAYLTASPTPLSGYDSTGDALNDYILRLLTERSHIRYLSEVTSLLQGAHHNALDSGDRRAIKRHVEIVEDSFQLIEKSKNIDTVKSRIGVIHDNLCMLHTKYFIKKAEEADILLRKLEPQIFNAIYCKIILNLYVKIGLLKTQKAKENKIIEISKYIQHLKSINYMPKEELNALNIFFRTYTG